MWFLVLSVTLAPLVWFGWNLEWTTVSVHHWWWVYFQGQKGHIKARWATFWPLFENFSIHSDSPFSKLQEFEKKVQKNSFQGRWPSKQLSALGSIFSAATHQTLTKFKSCGHFDPSFHFMKKLWPLKAIKAKKGPLTFFSLT